MKTSNDPAQLVQPMQAALKQLEKLLQDKGISLVLTNTTRSEADQKALYDAKLSPYRPGDTWHHYGYACTLVATHCGVVLNHDHPLWRTVGSAAEQVGLIWGGRWHGKIKQVEYFEWPCAMSLGAMRRARQGESVMGAPA